MTAGLGILHDEVPTEAFVPGPHPRRAALGEPARRLEDVAASLSGDHGDRLTLATSADGGTLVRLIAGDLDGHEGPGVTYTPITYAHAT